jgi:hypothetical protein
MSTVIEKAPTRDQLVARARRQGWRPANGGWERPTPGEPGTVSWSASVADALDWTDRESTRSSDSGTQRTTPALQRPLPRRVIFSERARQEILTHCSGGGVERGGVCWGRFYSDAISIESAHEVSFANRWNAMRLNAVLSDELEARTNATVLVSTWHSHPEARERGPGFSRSDLGVWKAWAKGRRGLANLLVAPAWAAKQQGLNPWVSPDWGAWVVSGDGEIRSAKLELDSDLGVFLLNQRQVEFEQR